MSTIGGIVAWLLGLGAVDGVATAFEHKPEAWLMQGQKLKEIVYRLEASIL